MSYQNDIKFYLIYIIAVYWLEIIWYEKASTNFE